MPGRSTHARERRKRERLRLWRRACVRSRGRKGRGGAAGVEHGVRLGGGGGGGGGRVQPGPGQRAAAAAGGPGAGDRDGAAVRGDGDPGAVQGEAQRAAAGPAGRAVRRLRAEGGGRALRPDPLPHPGGHRPAPRGLQLLGPQGLPDGPQPHRLRPPQAGGAVPRLRSGDRAAAVAPRPATTGASPAQLPPSGQHPPPRSCSELPSSCAHLPGAAEPHNAMLLLTSGRAFVFLHHCFATCVY